MEKEIFKAAGKIIGKIADKTFSYFKNSFQNFEIIRKNRIFQIIYFKNSYLFLCS